MTTSTTVIKTTSAVTLGGQWWAWPAGRRYWRAVRLAGVRRWAVEVRVFTHAHVSMITYRVHVYRSTPIGTSLSIHHKPSAWMHVATGCTVLVIM